MLLFLDELFKRSESTAAPMPGRMEGCAAGGTICAHRFPTKTLSFPAVEKGKECDSDSGPRVKGDINTGFAVEKEYSIISTGRPLSAIAINLNTSPGSAS